MTSHFAPWIAEQRPCWHCRDFRGLIYGGSAACCGSATGPLVRSMPQHGCSGFEREPGSDDEPERVPAALTAPAAARVLLAVDADRKLSHWGCGRFLGLLGG